MDTINFTRMEEGTVDEYALTSRLLNDHIAEVHVDNLLGVLTAMRGPSWLQGRPLRTFLQSATLAHRDGADEETVVCALLHDIGDILAPRNHSQLAAATLRPYVSEKNHWIVLHHGLFRAIISTTRSARTRTPARRCAVMPISMIASAFAIVGISALSIRTTIPSRSSSSNPCAPVFSRATEGFD